MKACDDETGNLNEVRANTRVERADEDKECDEEWSKAPSLAQVFFVPSLGEIFAQEHGGSRHSRYDEAPKRRLAGSSQEAGGDTSQVKGLDDASFGGRDANPLLGEVRNKREEAQAGRSATGELALASPSYGEVVEEGRQASAAVQGAGPAFARDHIEELAFRSIYGDTSHSRSTQQPLAQSIQQIKHLDRVLGDGETRQLMIYSSIYGNSNSSPSLPSCAQQSHAVSFEWDMA